jgi:glyoxylase-like metal-dependent hydrolase (beta-lactamase superfamily II)
MQVKSFVTTFAASTPRAALLGALISLCACVDMRAPAADAGEPGSVARLPVPAAARGVAIDQQLGYASTAVRGGLYWVTNGSDQAAFLVSSAGVIVIDAPPALAPSITAAVRAVTSQPITHLVYSHFHADHIGGASMISGTATVIAHSATKAALEAAADPRRPLPTVTFEDTYTLAVGDQTLELSYAGPSHVPGTIFIYAPAQRTLILVDIVWPGWVPFSALGDTFVGGHVGRVGTKADVQQTKAYVDDLFGEAGAALAAVSIQQVGAEIGYENVYALVDEWFRRMSKRCNDQLVSRWGTVLGGADVFGESHCLAAIQHLRID